MTRLHNMALILESLAHSPLVWTLVLIAALLGFAALVSRCIHR